MRLQRFLGIINYAKNKKYQYPYLLDGMKTPSYLYANQTGLHGK
ncbi:hypothetical protein CLOSCI_01795 [[Clostridium] scindens ATCC 35704]|nr:hypothetical protein CLOSCI_01795 [[Clostridium] scindens ATCC 35704]